MFDAKTSRGEMEGMEAMEDYEQFGQVRVASERTKVYLFTITLDIDHHIGFFFKVIVRAPQIRYSGA